MRFVNKQKFAAWLGAAALLLMSFAPLISQAFDLPSSSIAQVICTQSGVKQLPVKTPVQQNHANLFNHCAYCSLAADKPFMAAKDLPIVDYQFSLNNSSNIDYDLPHLASFYYSQPPSQAPPISYFA